MRDLVVLVADRNAEYAAIGALARSKALNTRSIDSRFSAIPRPSRGGGLDAAGEAEDTASFYTRTLKWQEAGLIVDEAVGLLIKELPHPAAK